MTYEVTFDDSIRSTFAEATVDDSVTPGEIDFLITTTMTQTLYVRAKVTMLTGALETIYTEEA